MGPGLHALPRSKLLRFRILGTLQRRRLGREGLHFAPIPGPSGSGDQVLGALSQLKAVAYPSPILATRFSECTTGAPSQVCHVSLLWS